MEISFYKKFNKLGYNKKVKVELVVYLIRFGHHRFICCRQFISWQFFIHTLHCL